MTWSSPMVSLHRSISVVAVAMVCAFLPEGLAVAQDARRSAAGTADLSQAVLVSPAQLAGPERKAVDMLLEEVQRRTLVRWNEVHDWPTDATAVVAVGTIATLKSLAGPHVEALGTMAAPAGAEGYLLCIFPDAVPAVIVAGNDTRGVLFGVGRLLRELHMEGGKVSVSADVTISTSPKQPVRGHQVSYRPKTNSYDGWTSAMWEQYIRDLAVFGTNSFELIPPRSDDAPDSPHFPLPQMEMMKRVSQICADYGLNVWIWYPALDEDYGDPATVEAALKEWDGVFSQLPRIDAVFVPGGDPGHTRPKFMLPFLEKETEVLHRTHPNAQMWMSPQGFDETVMKEFLDILVSQQPKWLSGLVFGPHNRMTISELRQAVPKQYPIRAYPDITHSMKCLYPVAEWDLAYATTLQREPINPRPMAEANIFRYLAKDTIGFISYSEGCNDDVNKIVWSCLGWDPDMPVVDIVRQYARYFIGDRYTDNFAQGLLALENNWRGPLLTNKGVMVTLRQFQTMERNASPQDKLNWRFQQALYRAHYDAYNYRRLCYETELEEQAMDTLRQADRIGSIRSVDHAQQILDRAVFEPVGQDIRARVFELAEALYQSIRMQLSVPRYQAIGLERGANLDLIDAPLNDRVWLEDRFAEVRLLRNEAERLKEIDRIVYWTDPGPGGFYDDLGNPAQQPHLIREPGGEADPEFRAASLMGFEYGQDYRCSWRRQAETRYDSPVRMHYDNLDPTAQYRLRVVYSNEDPMMRCVAGDDIEIHPYIKKTGPIKPREFDIPREATKDGRLDLRFYQELGGGKSGRGCQVAEVWLMKENQSAP